MAKINYAYNSYCRICEAKRDLTTKFCEVCGSMKRFKPRNRNHSYENTFNRY